jgi:hypothetical protein
MAVVAVIPVPKRRVKKTKGNQTQCALIVAPGINRSVANNFAYEHLNGSVSIFYIEEMPLFSYHVIGRTKPRARNAKTIKAQQIYILPDGAEISRFAMINTINLFPQVKLKRGQQPLDVIMVHGFTPEEIPSILEQGLDHFPN